MTQLCPEAARRGAAGPGPRQELMLVLDPNLTFSLDPLQSDISRGTSSMWPEGEHWALYPPLVATEGMI